jgi:hypothetical protein
MVEGASMIWKQERDALIAQTLAFVQSVTRKQEQAETPIVVQPPKPVEPKVDEPIAAPSPEALHPLDTAPEPTPLQPIPPSDMAAEIRARVASFRAHQQRFLREREEYFATTLARLRAAMKDWPPRPGN